MAEALVCENMVQSTIWHFVLIIFGSSRVFVNRSVDILHVDVMMHRLCKRNMHVANMIFDILDCLIS